MIPYDSRSVRRMGGVHIAGCIRLSAGPPPATMSLPDTAGCIGGFLQSKTIVKIVSTNSSIIKGVGKPGSYSTLQLHSYVQLMISTTC